MDNRTRAREWTICEEHARVIVEADHGSCPECNGDRALIQVVPKALLASVRREERLKVAEEVEYRVKRLQVSARYAGDVGRILREVRALAPSPPPDDETK